MKDASSYQSAREFGLLVIGESGGGKTSLMMEWPEIYVSDVDRNLRSGLDLYRRRHGKAKEDFWFDTPALDEAGKLLPEDRVWDNGRRQIGLAAQDPKVKAIGLDGLTRWMTYLQRYVVAQGSGMEKPLTVGGMTVMTKSHYIPFEALMTQFFVDLRAIGKPVIVTAHVRSGESDLTDAAMWQPYLVGGLRNTLPGLFTDYWLADTEMVTATTDEQRKRYPTGTRYFVRTAPNSRAKFKNSLGLPPAFEFTWEAFRPYLLPTPAQPPTKTTP